MNINPAKLTAFFQYVLATLTPALFYLGSALSDGKTVDVRHALGAVLLGLIGSQTLKVIPANKA